MYSALCTVSHNTSACSQPFTIIIYPEIKNAIALKEAEILMEEKQVQYWQEYRSTGQLDHSKQIKLLQQELVDMELTFNEISGIPVHQYFGYTVCVT